MQQKRNEEHLVVEIDLKGIRDKYGIRQVEIKEVLGVSRQTIHAYEQNKRMPKNRYDILKDKFPDIFGKITGN